MSKKHNENSTVDVEELKKNKKKLKHIEEHDIVNEASDESFPASDPPAWGVEEHEIDKK